MAVYASPFFQGILSLTENCVPVPPVTTYEDDFPNPYLRKSIEKGAKYSDGRTEKILQSLKLEKKYDRVPVKAQLCTPQSFEGSKKYQEALKSKRLCSKRVTTYMVDYQSPHDRKKLWELFEFTNVDKLGELQEMMKVISADKNEEKKPVECLEISGKVTTSIETKKGSEKEDVEIGSAQKRRAPKWKIEGWKAKKNCWLRPLSERQEYYNTLEVNMRKKDGNKTLEKCSSIM